MSAPPTDIREQIGRYVPGIRGDNSDHGFQRVLILLIGLAGQGKSSLINSCLCVLKEEAYRNVAGSGKGFGGNTKKRTSYHLTDSIWISDNRGFQTMKPGEILEVCAQLRYLRPMGDFVWDKDNLQRTVECIPTSYGQPEEFILPVIVHSLYNLTGDEEKSMRLLVKKCLDITGVPPIVAITKAGPPNNRSGGVAEIETLFGEMGCTRRITLENYTENSQIRSPEADNQFLHFLKVCVEEAEYAIRQRGRPDPQQMFAKHVADQVGEEKEEETKERKKLEDHLKKELEEERDKVRKLEEALRKEAAKRWYERCSVM